jgi:glutamine synthetase
VRCDILEPATMQGYERDPRSVAKRAEAYLKSTGIADTAFFGPSPSSSCSTTSAGAPT